MKLPSDYYLQKNVVKLARDLIGKVLCTRIEGRFTSGIIIETEAYAGESDKASHAYGGRRTKRTETMFMKGGHAYVYLCYGIHHLFNIVSNSENIPHAVLIRGIEPLEGSEIMLERRGGKKLTTSGPGTMSRALGIQCIHDGTNLSGNQIWIEDRGILVRQNQIHTGPRIGVEYAKEDALLPYRFLWRKK